MPFFLVLSRVLSCFSWADGARGLPKGLPFVSESKSSQPFRFPMGKNIGCGGSQFGAVPTRRNEGGVFSPRVRISAG